ncbi:MAG: hypothetical protein ACRDMZ_12740, partial [Solirubrobacteraceae bacterium]
MNLRYRLPAIARLRGRTKPHLSGAAERLVVVGNEARRSPAEQRETRVEAASASLFVIVAALLPRLFDIPSAPAVQTIALILAVAFVSRIEFDVGAGYTPPLQLIFIPALFVLHPAWAPLVV